MIFHIGGTSCRLKEADYGFRHDDAEDGNMVFVVDEATGAEKLVSIDLGANTMTQS